MDTLLTLLFRKPWYINLITAFPIFFITSFLFLKFASISMVLCIFISSMNALILSTVILAVGRDYERDTEFLEAVKEFEIKIDEAESEEAIKDMLRSGQDWQELKNKAHQRHHFDTLVRITDKIKNKYYQTTMFTDNER